MVSEHGVDKADASLSNNWLYFYDQLERCAFWLECVRATADRPLTDESVRYLLEKPVADGGTFSMAVNIVAKYGLVPNKAYPDRPTTQLTSQLKVRMKRVMHLGAHQIRANPAQAEATLQTTMERVYRLLSITLGTPPSEFVCATEIKKEKEKRSKTNSNKASKADVADAVQEEEPSAVPSPAVSSSETEREREGTAAIKEELRQEDPSLYGTGQGSSLSEAAALPALPATSLSPSAPSPSKDRMGTEYAFTKHTPLSYAAKYASDIPDYICVCQDPRHQEGQVLTVDFLGNVSQTEGGRDTRTLYLVVSADTYIDCTSRTLNERREPVWFGCEFRSSNGYSKSHGLLSLDTYADEAIGCVTEKELGKLERVLIGESQCSHAMLITGERVGDRGVEAFRVENSHGERGVANGFLDCSVPWLREFGFMAAFHPSMLPSHLVTLYKEALQTGNVVVLPPWDPMGALAL
ncbi:peptidase C1B, bleomycin hydrolase [Kipferlia bialata]|uniref:Peptidase C1B, bleomycin hydrolase n=1 Tax=Kipferlia bialata TaxID=797122 RepID=A0A9K3D0C9_9EUKA|nr:peptidase C1B, bleomycin hydrolase [Kipferlia bialata]|eukprot:g8628.t1